MMTRRQGAFSAIRVVRGQHAFVTGATGFVGGHVARALSSEGWHVKALVRHGGNAHRLEMREPAVEIVPSDLARRADIANAVAGCDAIVHVAGLVKARTLDDYRQANVRSTEFLLRAARQSAPEAVFVLVSSQAAAGPAREGNPVREGDVARPMSSYGVSKREAEEAVEREWTGPWIVLRPAVVYGPGDRGLLPLFRAAARGWVPVPAGRSRIQVIHAEQAALAIARAAGRSDLAGRTGFLCDPDPVTIRDFAGTIARLPPRPARLVTIPDGDRKSTRLNSSHSQISYAVFCLKKKNTPEQRRATLPRAGGGSARHAPVGRGQVETPRVA